MKKLLIAGLSLALLTTACQKQEEPKPAEPKAEKTEPAPSTQSTTPPPADQATPQSTTPAEPTKEHTHDHSHAGHDHAGHDHAHSDGDTYQCGDKTLVIAIHNHDGEMEAHITADNVMYDLAEDVQSKGRFTSNDSVAGDDKGMALTINGNNAKITTLDDKPLLDCTKKAS